MQLRHSIRHSRLSQVNEERLNAHELYLDGIRYYRRNAIVKNRRERFLFWSLRPRRQGSLAHKDRKTQNGIYYRLPF